MYRMMTVACILAALITGCSQKADNPTKDKPTAKAELPKDFSMAKTLTGSYKGKTVTIALAEDKTGTLTVEGADPIKLKWEEERPSGSRVNIKAYVMDSKAFAKRALTMYNSGKGFNMKMQYSGDNVFKVYCGLYVQDGKIAIDDGPFDLTAK